MKKTWHHLDRTQERRLEAEFKSLKIPFKKRLDLVWFLLVLTVFSVFILWWLMGVVLGHRFGLFDPPPIRPIPDPRILTNIRGNIRQNPLLDAVFHEKDGCVYLSQKGGTVHRFNPSTGLWSTENPGFLEQLVNPDIVLLRSGCGIDPLSYRKSRAQTRDQDSLWGLTANGGLLRRSLGHWEMVKSDTLFIGMQGQPVQQNQSTAAAVSPDHQWLMVGTKEDGFGVYHIKTRQWMRFPTDFFAKLPSPEITHIAWCRDRFRIGGPAGLVSFQPGTQNPLLQPHPEIDGSILDMDVDFQDRLWVLDKHRCGGSGTGGNTCLRLSRYDFLYESQAPKLLVNESQVFPDLTLDDLYFARYWDHRLITAGGAGVYSYDTGQHSWECHFKGDVSAVLPFSKGNGFYFGFTGGIGVVADGRYRPWNKADKQCTTWLLPYPHVNEKIVKLHHGKEDEVLALGLSGKLFGLEIDEEKVYLLFQGERTGLDAGSFRSAVAFGDIVLFTGDQSALVHNLATRSYKDVAPSGLPDWLLEPGVRITASGDQVYAAVPRGGETLIYRISVKDATHADFTKAERLDLITGAVGPTRDWDGQGIGLLAGDPDGRVIRYHQAKEALTGLKVMEMNGVPLLDAAPYGEGIMVATSLGLRAYDYRTRGWGSFHRYYGKSTPNEVVCSNGRVWMSTRAGQLLELTEYNKFEGRIGGEAGFDMSDAQISDVLEKDGDLYLGGNGWIDRYDPGQRRIVDRWDLPGNGEVRIAAITSTRQPITLTGGQALVGSQILDETAGRVLNLFMDNNYIRTVRQQETNGVTYKYLKSYPSDDPLSSSAACYFYNPFIGGGARKILDAAGLPGGNLVVSTEKGLYFYNPTYRSWYPAARPKNGLNKSFLGVEGAIFQKSPLVAEGITPRRGALVAEGIKSTVGGQLYTLGRYLVRIDEGPKGIEIGTIDLDTLQVPTGCIKKPVIIDERIQRVQAYALYPQDQRLAVIDAEGAVMEWLGGVKTEIEKLPPPGKEPLTAALEHVVSCGIDTRRSTGGILLFTTAGGIWQYDLKYRCWSEIPLKISLEGDSIKEINIGVQEPQVTFTIKTGKGRFFIGSAQATGGAPIAKPVEMRPVFTPSAGISLPAGEITDVQRRGSGGWTFVFKDRIRYFNPDLREWSPDIMNPAGNTPFIFGQVKDRGVIAAKIPGGQEWWVARQKDFHPVTFSRYLHKPIPGEVTALDNNGNVWRLMPGGRLIRHQQPLIGDYSPTGEPYETPFILETKTVKGAFEWPGRVLFDTDRGIRLLDKITRKEIPLPENMKGLKGVEKIINDGAQLWIRRTAGPAVRFEEAPRNIDIPREIKDQWDRLKRQVVRLPDGQEAYDPITRLVIDRGGRLMAERPGGEIPLAQAAALEVEKQLPPALDVGWLRWNRATKNFTVKTPTGEMVMPPDRFIEDGKPVFQEVDAVLAIGTNRVYIANREGIWRHSREDLSMNDPAILFQPVRWRQPLGAGRGGFITPDGMYDTEGRSIPSNQASHVVAFGDVTLTESAGETGIRGRIKQGTGSIDAFDTRGFTWDHHRRGLAYTSAGLMVHSDAGIHPVEGYTGFELPPGPAGPAGGVNSQGRLYSPQPDQVFFKSGTTWYRRQGPFDWQKGQPEPQANRVLIDNPTWKWELRDGNLGIRLKGNSHGFKLVDTAAGMAFTSDLLQDAAALGNRLMVMTEAFFERADPYSQLSHFQAARYPAMPTRSLQTLRAVETGDRLLLNTGNRYYLWDDKTRQFEPVTGTAPSSKDRLLAEIPIKNPLLRFTREASGQIKKELQVGDVTGNIAWVSFSNWNNQFPFDVVTSLAGQGEELYVGTRAGLQVYTMKLEKSEKPGKSQNPGKDTGIGRLAALYRLGGQGQEPLAAVEKVGTPVDRPGVITAYSTGEIIEKDRADKTFRRGKEFKPLKQRLRLQTEFWRFIDNDGTLEGRYRDLEGKYSTETISIKQGQLPHDLIKDIAVHGGRVYTLWENGWISRHGGLTIEIKAGLENENAQIYQPQRFIIENRELYLEGVGGRVWQNQGTLKTWEEVTDPAEVRGLLDTAHLKPILNRKQIRLVPAPAKTALSSPSAPAFIFEYRGLDGRWKPIPWQGDILGMDIWTEILYQEGKLWAATPVGLISFNINREGKEGPRVELDPDGFVVVAEPQKENRVLEITEMEARGDEVIVRCQSNSDLVYQGTLPSHGVDKSVVGAFLEYHNRLPAPRGLVAGGGSSDPFAGGIQVSEKESGIWEWRREGCKDFHPGVLKGKFRGEDLQLVGGRYGFDSINSLAFYREDRVEIGTENGGWYSVPLVETGDLRLSNYQRPREAGIDPTLIKEVRRTRTREGEIILGLRTDGPGFIRLGKQGITGKTDRFPQYLGSDGFWRYVQEDDGERLSITALKTAGEGGMAGRRMEEGRFTDDIVLGLPVSGIDKDGAYVLVPTEAGVLRLDEKSNLISIYPKASFSLPGGSAPRVLYMDHRLNPQRGVYLAVDGVHPLEAPREVITHLKPNVPPGVEVIGMEEGPQEFVRLRWEKENRRGWSLINPTGAKEPAIYSNTLFVHVAEWETFKKGAEPWLQVKFEPRHMEVLRYGMNKPYNMYYPGPLELLAAIVEGKRLLLIGKTDLWEINLEYMFSSASSPQ